MEENLELVLYHQRTITSSLETLERRLLIETLE